ncbi:HlyD family secretion protein [Mariprofundus erugo]|uniref:HlyD family secretion protein n=1 Tax=Mariprofundus erugo TaxID=2528639 RepID=A0A5R9GQI4_9PROT|nr:HlyD family secretion protein [Mariprofundus erugo]TLS66232.1 HlyD family secretion protein [Mariprofundus erugo]
MSEINDTRGVMTSMKRIVLLFMIPLLATAIAVWFYLQSSRYVSTDDAYVRADRLYVAAEVSGRISSLPVHEHQQVHAGDLLFTIDEQPYRLALDAAEANLAQVANDIEVLKASYRQKQALIAQAADDVSYFQRAYERARKFARSGASSETALDDAQHRLDGARLRQQVVQRELDQLMVQMGAPDRPVESYFRYRKAKADRDRAALELQHTRVYAGCDGVIGPLNVVDGDYVQAGKSLFAVVSADYYIVAHLKETALTHVQAGQLAELRIDTYPDRIFQGRVESISPATGAEFSLLPAENSSGNWVKVVQRVTVRLAFDKSEKLPALRSGLSVDARIFIAPVADALSASGSH